MRTKDVFDILEGVGSTSLSKEYCEKYDAYDNSGILLDSGDEVKKILFSLDFSKKALARAKEIGANMMVTHHPAIYGKISSLDGKLYEAARSGISILSMHLNFDCAAKGIDERLKDALGGEKRTIAEPLSEKDTGYGRAYAVQKQTLSSFVENAKKNLGAKRVLVYESQENVEKVASFCGAGADEKAVAFAVKEGADTIVSADFKHHIVLAAQEAGLNVVALTHYASENFAFEGIYRDMKDKLGAESEYFTDEELL